MADENLIYRVLDEKPVVDAYIFKLWESHRVSPGGKPMTVHVVQPPDWVQVLGLVKDSEGRDSFLMVRQFRHGSRQVLTEFPGGMVDPGENPRQAAERELREETGYEAREFISLGSVNPNPAFMTNTTHAFLARGLEKKHDQDLDEHEHVDVEVVPVEHLVTQMGIGSFNHGIMILALWWYQRWKSAHPGT